MGRHKSGWLPDSPSGRFLIAVAGIVVLAFATFAIVAMIFPTAT